MAIICVRVLSEKDTNVFRDIEIDESSNFVQFHEAIKEAWEFDDNELASFYLSDEEWNKGQEIVLDDLGEGDEPPLMMQDTIIGDHITSAKEHLFYVYDFLMCKTFFIEVMDISDPKDGAEYPRCIRKVGETPEYDDPLAGLNVEDFMNDLPSLDDEPKMESLDDPDLFNDDMFDGFDDFNDFR